MIGPIIAAVVIVLILVIIVTGYKKHRRIPLILFPVFEKRLLLVRQV